MRPGRPKQHTHNWVYNQWNLGKMKIIEAMPDGYGNENNFGGEHRPRWECIRGGKVKHFHNIPRINPIYLRGSGTFNEDWLHGSRRSIERRLHQLTAK